MYTYKTPFRFAAVPVIVSWVLLSQPATAQAPSAEETIEYINSKLATCRAIPQKISEDYIGLRIESGILITTDEKRWYLEDFTMQVRYDTLSTNVQAVFKEFSHGFIGAVEIKCGKPKCFKPRENIPMPPRVPFYFLTGQELRVPFTFNDSSDSFRFFLCNSDDVERVKKAFVHLLSISGGKDELF